MASALGWYIHYRASNYKKYGISPGTKKLAQQYGGENKNTKNLFSLCQSQRQHIFEQVNTLNSGANVSDKDVQLLEQFLNETKKQLGKNMLSNSKQIQADIEQEALKDIEDGLAQIDWNSLKVVNKADFAQIGVGKQLRATGKQFDIKTIQTALSKINQLEDAISKNLIKGGGTAISASVIQQIQNLKKTYQDANFALTKKGSKKTLSKKMQDSVANARIELIKNLETYVPYLPVHNAQGKVFEYLLEKIPSFAQEVAENSANDELKNFVKSLGPVLHQGDKTLSASVDVNLIERTFFASTQETKTANENYVKTFLESNLKHGSSEDKIDISMRYSMDSIFNLSLKSYDLSKANYLKLVENSPLLYLLQDQNTDFVNHLFNVYSTHYEKGKEESSAVSFIQNQRKILKADLQLTLIFKALTGINIGRPGAAFLVLNDVSVTGGGIKVYRVKDLMQKIEQSLYDKAGPISVKDESGKSLDNMSLFVNNWVNASSRADGAMQRNLNVLKEAYDRKISVKLKIAAINGQIIHKQF